MYIMAIIMKIKEISFTVDENFHTNFNLKNI